MVHLMHEYLDEELSAEDEKKLKTHLQACEACRTHFQELNRTIAYVQSSSHIQAPENFTQKVMNSLPNEKRKKAGVERWLQNNPFFAAAAIFLVLMGVSLLTTWSSTDEFSFTNEGTVIVEDKTVVVPQGEVIEGDVIVRNGDLRVEGEVNGKVTVINGDSYLAGAGSVTGEIEEIDQAFEWLWYNIKKAFQDLGAFFQSDETP
ncbi:zf-HC2 domain-containing protein [Jeotgalibacillus proteolyticus]|uniref:Anti-sigma-W factor RsiW n=1 Tax=Jeotgalibacillus proteolyticus TaxID=2082395 RepID=A0A2S5GDP9_9BACL|nr:zf-HC2 domain-containing protein [Jeotgalibacillus proteolyticus]PPA71167.1 anti-sigma factor [Jeotgalibacillus proteolyticus]